MSKKFKHLRVPETWRHYWSKYPEGYTILEALLNWVNSVNDLTENINNWNEYLDDFVENFDTNLRPTVEAMLDEMEADGRLSAIINETIFTDLNDTINETVDRVDTIESRVNSLQVSVRDFGAMGDGTEQSTEIQAAIDHVHENGGGRVYVPAGTYVINTPLEVYSNMTIEGEGNATHFIREAPASVLFNVEGTQGEYIALSENAAQGDQQVTVLNATPFSRGDYFKIVGQRDAQHEDAGRYRLGRSTSQSHSFYFGEIQRVTSVVGDVLHFNGGLIFPDYNTTNSEETSPRARSYSTVHKMNFKSNVNIGKFKATGRWLHVVRMSHTRNSSAYNILYDEAPIGAVLTMVESLNCEGRDLIVHFNNTTFNPETMYHWNCFKTISTQSCGFERCEAYHGGQAFDFTYNTFDIGTPNMFSYARNSKVAYSNSHALTAHGGAYAVDVINNEFTNIPGSVIALRAPYSHVSGNRIVGSGSSSESGYAVGLVEGSAHNTVVSDNHISNVYQGVFIQDGDGVPYREMNILITNNHFSNIIRAVELSRAWTTTFDLYYSDNNLSIVNNVFYFNDDYVDGVGLNYLILATGGYFKGINVLDNTCNGSAQTRFIQSVTNTFNWNIDGNLFFGGVDSTSGVIRIPAVSDRANYPDIPTNYMGLNNYFENFPTEYRLGTAEWRHHYFHGHLVPRNPDTKNTNIGLASARFNSIALKLPPSVESDIRFKENVTPLKSAIELIKELKPVEYNLKSNPEGKHIGLIAQDVEQAIKVYSDEEYHFIQKDEENGYSLSYEELIPLLIKSIQELNERIDK